MKTLDRYIAGIFVKNLGLALFGLAAFYLFQATLSDLMDKSYPAHQTVIYNLLQLPAMLVQMAPPSVMIATVLTLSGLNRSNELTAAYSIGFGLGRIVSLITALVVIFCCLLLVLQDRILPPLYRKRTTFYWQEMKKRTDFFLDVKQDKIWYRSKNLIYNLRTFDAKSKTIRGMAVYTFDEDFNLVQTVEAEQAAYTPTGWKLIDGTVTVFNKDDPFPMTKPFKEKDLLIQETPKDFQEIEREVDGLRLRELAAYIERSRAAGVDTKGYEVKYHSRWSLSFIPLVMAMLGVPFSTRSRREGGVARDLGSCLAVTFFYWLFHSVGLSLGSNGALPPVLAAWIPSTVFAALAAVLIFRQRK